MANKKVLPTEKAEAPEKSIVQQNFSTMAEISRGLTEEQKDVIRNTIAPSLNDSELRIFLYRAHRLGLDPLNGEIYAYSSGQGTNRKLVVIIARDGKRVIAERSRRLLNIKSEAIYRRKLTETIQEGGKSVETTNYVRCEPWEGGELWGATATVVRSDRSDPYTVTVSMAEYKMGSPVWSSKPETMIKKVAESQALSLAFPEMSGFYDEAEKWDEPKSIPTEMPDDNEPATEQMLETLSSLDIKGEGEITKGEARRLIREATTK